MRMIFCVLLGYCIAVPLLQAGNMEGVIKQTKAVSLEETKLTARDEVQNGKTRSIKLLEDRDQKYMTTKVYKLKYITASDLTPFVEGAVKRADLNSNVSNLTYKQGKENFLSVSMPNFMVPYIDDMISKLDRNGVKDQNNSLIEGTGIHHFYYSPNYRATETMQHILQLRFNNGDEVVHFGPGMSFFYWKGSAYQGREIGIWLKAMDRPLPQMQIRLKIYQITESDLKELGFDWIALKNGPLAEVFGMGFDFMHLQSLTDFSHMMDFTSLSSFSNPGIFVAPNIDMTFLRLLAQKGKSRVATSTYLTLVNDQNYEVDEQGNFTWSPYGFAHSRYRISFNPQFQTITKTNDQYQEMSLVSRQPGIKFFVSAPLICFDNAAISNQTAIVNFHWDLAIENSMTESTNTGDLVQNNFYFGSYTKLRANSEKLLATYVKVHKVTQNNGIPFLSEIPILKYIFGSTSESKIKYRYFVTVEAMPADPMDSTWSAWAGKLVTAQDMLQVPVPKKKIPLRKEWAPAEFVTPTKNRKK